MEDYKIPYLAGLFDGEGCIYIANHKGGRGGKFRYTKLRMIISNTNKEIIDWLVTNYGGWTQTFIRTNPKHNTGYNWWTEGEKAANLLASIFPYSIIKRKPIIDKLQVWLSISTSHNKNVKLPMQLV
jgi:hypothetical protein